MILERVVPRANWFAGLEVALTRPPGVPERRDGEDHWNPEPVKRPRRIADDLAWFRAAMDHPDEAGLRPLDEALPSTWDLTDDAEAGERLLRLEERGVLQAAGFALHQPDLERTDP
jgi:hypothetical protein